MNAKIRPKIALAVFITLVGVGFAEGFVDEATEHSIAPAPNSIETGAVPAAGQPIQFKIPFGGGQGRPVPARTGRFARLGNRIRAATKEIDEPRAQMLIQGLDFVLGPDVNVGLSRDGGGIDVRIHPAAISNTARNVRSAPIGYNRIPVAYGLAIYPETSEVVDATAERKEKRLVVLIHGFASSPNRFGHVVRFLRDKHLRVATFHYDTQHGVTSAAAALSTHLSDWIAKNPDYKITLLGHSMGGICGRCLIESDSLDCASIDQLIMVASPNHGSELARIGLIDQPIQTGAAELDRPQLTQLIRMIATQVSAATRDMRPDSEVLKQLNSGSRNDRVDYTILLGNKAPLSQKQSILLAEVISELGGEHPAVDVIGQQAAETLDQMSDEWVGHGGDGVVSVVSGRLEGVDDVEVLGFSHNDLLHPNSVGWDLLADAMMQRLLK